MNTTATRLRALRESAGISAREVDRLAGLCYGHTWLVESGKNPNPEVQTVQALATALGSTVGYLAAGEGFGPTRDRVLAALETAREKRAVELSAVAAELANEELEAGRADELANLEGECRELEKSGTSEVICYVE